MRTLTLALLGVALATAAAAEDKKPVDAAGSAPAAPTLSPADVDRALTAIGTSIAKSLESLALSPAEQAKVLAAIKQAQAGKGAEIDEKSQADIRAFVQARMTAAGDKEKARGIPYQQAAAKEKGAIKTASGAIVVPIKEGTGASPGPTDKVKVNYTGTLIGGKVFDSTSKHNPPAPIEFPLNGVVPCWTEALQKMKVGGHAKVVCPPEIAYGERGAPGIPGNSTLTFDIELLEVTKAPPPTATPAPVTPK